MVEIEKRNYKTLVPHILYPSLRITGQPPGPLIENYPYVQARWILGYHHQR